MSGTVRKLEVTSYIAIIAASALLCYVLIAKILISPKTNQVSSQKPALPTEPVAIAGVDWTKSNKSLVLAISTHCPYCLRSTAFYHQLTEARSKAHSNVQMIALLPEPADSAQKFLDKNQVSVDKISDPSSLSLPVEATPTLLIVDSHGKVTNEWVGKLSPAEEKEVARAFLN